jgi:hypothetical protein
MTYGDRIVDLIKIFQNITRFMRDYAIIIVPEFLDKTESKFRFLEENEKRDHKIIIKGYFI